MMNIQNKSEMNRLRPELLKKMIRLNEEYNRVEILLTPYGFTLCGSDVFYGERPHSLYCGKIEDYQMFIDNLVDIKKDYLKYKMERLGSY